MASLIDLAPNPLGARKTLAQHVGGVALSGKPLSELIPTRESAMIPKTITANPTAFDPRARECDRRSARYGPWDKDGAHDAGFTKIDILSLSVLDQLGEALN